MIGIAGWWLLLACGLSAAQTEITPSCGRDWDPSCDAALEPVPPGLCTLPRIAAADLTPERFLAEFKGRAAVVVMVGPAANAALHNATARPALLAAYSAAPLTLSSANTYSHRTVTRTLGEYVNDLMTPQTVALSGAETLYSFGGHDPTVWSPLLDHYRRPPCLRDDDRYSYSFGIAACGTGVPFHVHGDGFSEVIHGRKRWFLYPPGAEPALPEFAGQRESFFRPDASTLQWVLDVYPRLPPSARPLECVLGPGEALYFPTNWYHATLNLGETVFLSTFT